jgi:23S rRNA pseudouridine2605 synthase
MERKPRQGKSGPEQSSKETRKPTSGKERSRTGSRTTKPVERKETNRSSQPKQANQENYENFESTRRRTSPGRDSRPDKNFKPASVRKTSTEKPADAESPRRRTSTDREARSDRNYKSSSSGRGSAEKPGRPEYPRKRTSPDKDAHPDRNYKPTAVRSGYTEKPENSESPRKRTSPGRDTRTDRNFKTSPIRRAPSENSDDSDTTRFRKSEGSDSRPDRRKDESHTRKPYAGKKEGYGRPQREESKYSSGRRPSRPAPGSNDGLIRLNKYIANSGICSRREADELILAGVVMVNGKVVTELGTKVSPTDKVQYDNHTIRNEKHVYVLLNKPKGYITTTDDPFDRKTVMTLVADACKERIYPVGRLDRNTTGLLLLTNDGDIAKKLTHPRHRVKKVYHVEVDKAVTKSDMIKMATEGVELEDGVAIVDEVAYAEGGSKKEVGVELHSGKNRIVRRIFEALGYEVVKLDRLSFAGLTKKDLPRGKWRLLTEQEVNYLKMLK